MSAEPKDAEDLAEAKGEQHDLAIVAETACFCLRGESIERWQAFMTENQPAFAGQSDGEEFTLEQTAVHEQFCALVDASIAEFLSGKGWTVPSFFELLRVADSDGDVAVFVTLLSSCSDFQAFADIMSDSNKRAYYFSILSNWHRTLEAK